MTRPLLAGALLLAGTMVSVGAVAAFVAAGRPPFAIVIKVEPRVRPASVQRLECDRVLAGAPGNAARGIADETAGGMLGALFAHRHARPASTPRVTAMGASDANLAAARPRRAADGPGTHPDPVGGCRIVHRTELQVYAYDVTYRLDGRPGKVRMDHDPGARIEVEAGKLIASRP